MKNIGFLIFLLLGAMSCASSRTDFSKSNKLYFLSENELIDVVSVQGIDLGRMYRPESEAVSSQNFGKKGYTTYDGIVISDEIFIFWKPSKVENAEVIKAELSRPPEVPEKLADNTSLVLEYLGSGLWKIYVYDGTMLL